MNTMLYKTSSFGEIVDADDSKGLVKGYASIFNNIDSDSDMIMRGAYAKTLKENGYRVKYLYQHDMSKPLGKMRELYEDDKGLAFVAEIPKTTLGKDVMELMKAGVISENSVGIMPIKKEDKSEYRELQEVKLYEVSAVTLAANDQAMILDVKGNVDLDKISTKYDSLIKVIKKGEITDDLAYAIESELLKLKSYFLNQVTLPTEEVTKPTENKGYDPSEVFKYLSNKLQS